MLKIGPGDSCSTETSDMTGSDLPGEPRSSQLPFGRTHRVGRKTEFLVLDGHFFCD